jgi:hypothetical protein
MTAQWPLIALSDAPRLPGHSADDLQHKSMAFVEPMSPQLRASSRAVLPGMCVWAL